MFKKALSLAATLALCIILALPASASSLLESLGTVHNLRDYEPTLTEVLTRVAEEAKGKPYKHPEYEIPSSSTENNSIPSPTFTTTHYFGESPSSVFVK